ncbi:MAG: prepilin-type N-terminal cleavage/methylation domain-containing protein [Planctomycetota bacterium]
MHHPLRARTAPSHAAVRAFTIVEVLVVISVISVLIVILIPALGAVAEGGRKRLTLDIIRVMDNAYDGYLASTSNADMPNVVETLHFDANLARNGRTIFVPWVDGIDATDVSGGSEDGKVLINTSGLFVTVLEAAGLGALLDDVPQDRVRRLDIDGQTGAANRQPELPTIVDAWDQPIRAVHPAFDGVIVSGHLEPMYNATSIGRVGLTPTQSNTANLDLPISLTMVSVTEPFSPIQFVRRNFLTPAVRQANAADLAEEDIGDSDGGRSPNGRVYFYSPGRDGDPSRIESNVYTTEVVRPTIN